MTVDVLTCIVNDYDNLRPPLVRSTGVRWVCYSDEPRFDSGWEIQPVPQPFSLPSQNSRIPKMLAHFFSDADVSIWMDACLQPRADVTEILDLMHGADILGIRHPRLNAVRELDYCTKEAESLGFVGQTDHMRKQVDAYRQEGWAGEPFVCGGILVRRNNAEVKAFNELWWREYRRWFDEGQTRDQFSLNYAIWKSGVTLKTITEHHILETPWFTFKGHAAFKNLGDNEAWEPDRKRRVLRRGLLANLLG
jgi:hypothetical protein